VNVYLIRHLATAGNEAGIWMGRGIDLPILDSQKQAFDERLGRVFSNGLKGKAAVYCGPSKRTVMTAAYLIDVLKLKTEAIVISEFNEDKVGRWEGESIAETREEFPLDFEKWQNDPENFRFPGGESFVEVRKRVFPKLLEIAKNEMVSGTSNLFVITHGDPIRLTVCTVMQTSINTKNDFLIDNGSVTKLEFDGEKFMVKELNYL
jgi:alpha-ribazole phosphatase